MLLRSHRELAVPRPTLYIPNEQFGIPAGRLAIRTTADAGFVATVVTDAVRAADPALRVTRVAADADYLRVPLARPRFNTPLLTVFAAAPSPPPGCRPGAPRAWDPIEVLRAE